MSTRKPSGVLGRSHLKKTRLVGELVPRRDVEDPDLPRHDAVLGDVELALVRAEGEAVGPVDVPAATVTAPVWPSIR